ncbi:hypothetical protein BO94DRAFT_497503 [Aspergillus sclerotioniger CBS 115572]|uniref:F-box domain-containing protein n=1 Tax=Aspergillus sclerotioniger CBS 115572 TaxID=1450535 RepID=A0A317W2V2_9EURO|nr:hypothetical protein BO94DRAFT_497503 [Aspergillus sclerotioniger CBS 115572]PWY79518.1 hypothetical protein BO94DRAFT_497503 [Aspergillus sclerotioniger CBS 115572]
MDRLPVEVLWSIDQQIDDLETRRALSQCSRRLYEVFSPLIFSSIEGRGPHPCLVKHLWRRPDLACSVRNANIHSYSCLCTDFDRVAGDKELVEEMANEVCEEKEDRAWWKDHLQNNCPDALLAVLLTRLTHLESITLESRGKTQFVPLIVEDMSSDIRGRVRVSWGFSGRPVGQRRFSLPFLQAVSLNGELEHTETISEFATSLLYLPTVRRIHFHGLWDLNPNLSDAIQSHNPKETHDGMMLSGKLTHFQVEIGSQNELSWTHYYFRASEFRQLLLPSKDTLESLSLDFDSQHRYRVNCLRNARSWGANIEHLPFGSFREFHVLKKLRIRHANLAGLPDSKWKQNSDEYTRPFPVDLLPSSLTSITITEVLSKFVHILISDVEALLKVKDEETPRLENINLHICSEQTRFEEIRVLLGSLTLMAESTGVRMVYELEEMDAMLWNLS